ncbi:efflux RND transporter periplasmic adaptor subunit [Zhouia sp. PK063]|uniref:efflux RND transporter periplasmic adaptor subunit n=1 Tax=Zhouia sp. PK063 TaxID=3373602 RepID=UPI0037956A64
MKRIILSFIVIATLAACGGKQEQSKSVETLIKSGSLKELTAKRQEISNKVDELETQLKQLNEVISKKDTTGKKSLITVLHIKDTLFQHYTELQGSVDTKQNLVINAEYSGTLTKLFVNEGQKVNKGQLLAKIDDGGLSSQLAQLKAQAALAKTTFERQKRLWDQKIGSEIQYLQAKTQYESAENAVNQMQSQIDKSNVKAPFSGVIDDVIAEQGSNVAPGTPLIRIVNLSDMYIDAEIPEKYLSQVKEGSKVLVYFPVLGDSITTKIRQASNYINPANRSFKIEVPVPNKNGAIKPNLTARMEINDYTNDKAILIPQSVISENAEGEQYVYVVVNKDNKKVAKRTIIKTGQTQGDEVEILSGINEGDQVIEEGARSVLEGQEVEIKN